LSYKDYIRKLEEEVKARFVGNEESIHVAVMALLHPRSTILIRAPRGLGKSTLMLLFLKGIFGDDFVVVSGASEVKRGEVVGRLHIPSLEKEGVERVLWAAFVEKEGKGLDEANRLNPYTAASIYHMMQFGEAWAYGQRSKVKDYVLIANENPRDPTTFTHPPPFYDRFDVTLYLKSLTLSEKFRLQNLLEKYEGDLVNSMPQVLTFEQLQEARKEVAEVELDVEVKGAINMLIRDLQACVRDRDYSSVKPLALCEGCHFIRDVCSMISTGPSERATVVLMRLAKSKAWLDGKCGVEDIIEFSRWVLPHRIEFTRARAVQNDIGEIIEREKVKMAERDARKQWFVLNELYKRFDRGLYRRAKEIALEDIVFAEELMELEKKWVDEGVVSREETLLSYFK